MSTESSNQAIKATAQPVFRLLDLPTELRELVYSQCFPDSKVIYWNYAPRQLQHVKKISQVNRQLRAEVIKRLWTVHTLWVSTQYIACKEVPLALAWSLGRFLTSPVVSSAVTKMVLHLKLHLATEVKNCVESSFRTFPALKRLEVELTGTCLFAAGTGRLQDSSLVMHGPEPFNVDALMDNPAIKWLCQLRGLEEFVLTATTLCPFCDSYDSDETVSELDDADEDVSELDDVYEAVFELEERIQSKVTLQLR